MRIGLSNFYLSDFVSAFNEIESTMYSIHEGDYEDEEELTSKDRKLLKKISDNAKKMYKEKYSWNLMEKKLISAYNDFEKIGGIND